MAVVPSPNIWHWPDVYELENQAQDVEGALFAALPDWTGWDVVDVGCGAGFHLPRFAESARTVIGVEPHRPLVTLAERRTEALPSVQVVAGSAESLPLPDASADLVHARTAYFFGAGCEPGISEAMRVLRPGGVLVVVDLDATAHPYGEWMCADLKNYRPHRVEQFFVDAGFDIRRVDTRWEFASRDALASVLGIEFAPRVARAALRATTGLALDVRYRVHTLRKPRGLIVS